MVVGWGRRDFYLFLPLWDVLICYRKTRQNFFDNPIFYVFLLLKNLLLKYLLKSNYEHLKTILNQDRIGTKSNYKNLK